MAELLGVTSLIACLFVVGILSFFYKPARYALLVAFALRALAACVHYWIFPLPHGVADARIFEQVAWGWAQEGLFHAALQFNPSASYVYSWVASLIYAVTARSALMLQALNALGGTLIVLNVYLIARELWGRQRAQTVAWFVALFPFLIQISAVTHREVAIVYPFTLGSLFLVRWVRRDKVRLRHLGAGLLFFGIATIIHGGMIAAIFGAVTFLVASAFKNSLKRLVVGQVKISAMVVFLIIGGGGIGMAVGGGIPEISKVGNLTGIGAEMIASMAEARAEGEAAYLEETFPTSLTEVVLQMPLRVVYFLFAPMPWHVSSAGHLIALLTDVTGYIIVFFGLWGSRHQIVHERGALALLAILLAAIAAFALVTSNFGTAMRHRAKFIPILAALWASPLFRFRIVLKSRTPKSSAQENN